MKEQRLRMKPKSQEEKPGTNVPGQRGEGACVERARVMDTRDI
jgi:hypothetical protein